MRKVAGDWGGDRMLSDAQVREVLSLKENEFLIFSVEDFGDRPPQDFRVALINYMRIVKKVKIKTKIIDREVRVTLVDRQTAAKIVGEEKKPINDDERPRDVDGCLLDDNGQPLMATAEEMEAKRIRDAEIMSLNSED